MEAVSQAQGAELKGTQKSLKTVTSKLTFQVMVMNDLSKKH